MICLPSCFVSCAAKGLAKASVPPPAGNGTTKVIGLVGHSWAMTAKGAAHIKNNTFFNTLFKVDCLVITVSSVCHFSWLVYLLPNSSFDAYGTYFTTPQAKYTTLITHL
jgi:hypothetical protein